LDGYWNVCRNKSRRVAAQMAREAEFEQSINVLFDISHHDCMNLIKIEEDKLFLKKKEITVLLNLQLRTELVCSVVLKLNHLKMRHLGKNTPASIRLQNVQK